MARARWLKPEFFTDSKVCAVSDQAALVFEAVWVEADDGGVAPGDPRDLYGRRFIKRPGWTVSTVTNAVSDLTNVGLLRSFDHRGETYLLIPDFIKKQGIKPKEWRHLGKDHTDVVERVLSQWNGVSTESNGVSSRFTPIPVPEPSPVPVREPLHVALAELPKLPETAQEAFQALCRSSRNPKAWAAEIEALTTGLTPPAYSWATVGQALREMSANGDPPRVALLRSYCRKLQDGKPPSLTPFQDALRDAE